MHTSPPPSLYMARDRLRERPCLAQWRDTVYTHLAYVCIRACARAWEAAILLEKKILMCIGYVGLYPLLASASYQTSP
jgi:hypothetical protein